MLPLPRAGSCGAACCVYCFILYRIYCIVLLHRVLLHIALLYIVLSVHVSDNGGGSRQGDYRSDYHTNILIVSRRDSTYDVLRRLGGHGLVALGKFVKKVFFCAAGGTNRFYLWSGLGPFFRSLFGPPQDSVCCVYWGGTMPTGGVIDRK